MNILILHNNNIPVDLRLSFEFDGNTFHSEVVEYKPYERADFDSFLCMRLSSLFQNTQYDLVVLPYTLGENNYSEYSGLRIAAHIRLTRQWNHFATPLLFIGGDDPTDVLRFSGLGALLYTYRVYTSNARIKEELTNRIKHIDCGKIEMSYNDWIATQKYQEFINRINIKAPANYASHHSVANKWAVLRWIEMFSWDGDAPKFEDEGFKNMLYFKYLMAKAGQRELFKKKDHKRTPEITYICDDNSNDKKTNEIKRKRIIYIDDEEAMWSKVLSPIFQKSKIDFSCYHFDKYNQISKNELIQNIESFLKQDYVDNGGADCYLIDLRLHDDDFANNIESKELSGQKISRFIKTELNKGCQIVIFTASNKSWNIETSMIEIGACGYVLKESPELNYSRDDSYQLFCDFSKKIKRAFKQSYLQNVYRTLDKFKERLKTKGIDISALYEYVDLLNTDKGANKSSILKSCALYQYVFLENLIQNVLEFRVEASGNILKKWVSIGRNTSHCILLETSNVNGYSCVVNIKYLPENSTKRKIEPLTSSWEYLEDRLPSPSKPKNKEKPFDYMIAALLIYYGIDVSCVKKTVDLGYERNTAIAHGNKAITIALEDLQDHFEKVIVPILKKESEN